MTSESRPYQPHPAPALMSQVARQDTLTRTKSMTTHRPVREGLGMSEITISEVTDTEFEMLAEAVRILHTQAHTQPTDSLYAERCRREPCSTVGHLLDVADGDVKGLFGVESRAS